MSEGVNIERTWRDVAVYRTYPMSREACTCGTITGYFCSICEKPVCDKCKQEHTDFHWQNPGMYVRGLPKEVVAHQEQINGVHDDMLYASALGMMALETRLTWYKRIWLKIKRAIRRFFQ